MSEDKRTLFDVASGEITVWVDQSAIMIKLNNAFKDPVELATFEAQELAELLMRLVREERG